MQEIAITPEEDAKENASVEVAELQAKGKELAGSLSSLQQQKARIDSQIELLSQYSTGLFTAGKDASTSDLLDQTTIGRKT